VRETEKVYLIFIDRLIARETREQSVDGDINEK